MHAALFPMTLQSNKSISYLTDIAANKSPEKRDRRHIDDILQLNAIHARDGTCTCATRVYFSTVKIYRRSITHVCSKNRSKAITTGGRVQNRNFPTQMSSNTPNRLKQASEMTKRTNTKSSTILGHLISI